MQYHQGYPYAIWRESRAGHRNYQTCPSNRRFDKGKYSLFGHRRRQKTIQEHKGLKMVVVKVRSVFVAENVDIHVRQSAGSIRGACWIALQSVGVHGRSTVKVGQEAILSLIWSPMGRSRIFNREISRWRNVMMKIQRPVTCEHDI